MSVFNLILIYNSFALGFLAEFYPRTIILYQSPIPGWSDMYLLVLVDWHRRRRGRNRWCWLEEDGEQRGGHGGRGMRKRRKIKGGKWRKKRKRWRKRSERNWWSQWVVRILVHSRTVLIAHFVSVQAKWCSMFLSMLGNFIMLVLLFTFRTFFSYIWVEICENRNSIFGIWVPNKCKISSEIRCLWWSFVNKNKISLASCLFKLDLWPEGREDCIWVSPPLIIKMLVCS